MDDVTFWTGARLEFAEYVEFLRHSDLGRQYPAARFQERVSRLLAMANVVVTAREG